jgi:hypothetical protein
MHWHRFASVPPDDALPPFGRFLEGKIVVPLDKQLAESILKVRRSIIEVVGSLSADVGITVREQVTGFDSGGDSSCHLARRFFSFGPYYNINNSRKLFQFMEIRF